MNLLLRKASVSWKSGAKGGVRKAVAGSGGLKLAKSAADSPLSNDSDTVRAESIAAAHASSFSLALSNELGLKVGAAGQIVTTATATMEHHATGWALKNIHLNVVVRLPKVTQGAFIDAAVRAKTSCLVSRLLHANITMNAKLET